MGTNGGEYIFTPFFPYLHGAGCITMLFLLPLIIKPPIIRE